MIYSEYIKYFRDAIRTFSKKRINFSENSFAYALAQTVASLAAKNEAALNNIQLRTSLSTATSEDLDNLLNNFNIQRKLPSKSSGFVDAWVTTLPATPTLIPIGTIISDNEGNQYITTESAVIPSSISHYPTSIQNIMGSRFYAIPLDNSDTFTTSGLTTEEIREQLQSTIQISASSVLTGSIYNIEEDTISITQSGNIRFSNSEPFTGGADLESDEQFRSRALAIIRGANSKFTKSSLSGFLLSQSGIYDAVIVEDCGCLSFVPPITGNIFAVINTSLVANVGEQDYSTKVESFPKTIYEVIRKKIEEGGYRPAGIGVTVIEAEINNVGFKSTSGNVLKIKTKDSNSLSLQKTTIQGLIYNYFLQTKIGDTIYKADIIELIKSYDDVLEVYDFDFLKITGYDSSGDPISEEVDYLSALANQVFRVRGTEYIKIVIEQE